jgi:hypothetical protein
MRKSTLIAAKNLPFRICCLQPKSTIRMGRTRLSCVHSVTAKGACRWIGSAFVPRRLFLPGTHLTSREVRFLSRPMPQRPCATITSLVAARSDHEKADSISEVKVNSMVPAYSALRRE